MDVEDIDRGLKACRQATKLPWQERGDCFVSDGPYPDWFPKYQIYSHDGRQTSTLFDTRETRKADVKFVETASDLLPAALAALKRIRKVLAGGDSLSIVDCDRILNESSGVLEMEISDDERFGQRVEELFGASPPLGLYSTEKYRASADLLREGRLEEAFVKLEETAIEYRSRSCEDL